MQSSATTVAQYMKSLPADRRAVIQPLRQLILDNLHKQFVESMQYGMISYVVPLSIYPAGYHTTPNQPLPFVALASQKNYCSLYLFCFSDSCDESTDSLSGHHQWFIEQWKKTGKKLNMGKCCVRFKKLEDLALDVIAQSIKRVPVSKYIQWYEKMRQNIGKPPTTAAQSKVKKKIAGKARPK